MTNSCAGGTSTSEVEVLNVSPRGIWLLVRDREFFLPTRDFPWFSEAKLADVYNVEFSHGHHLHWPALDVDLDVARIENPSLFPLIAGPQ